MRIKILFVAIPVLAAVSCVTTPRFVQSTDVTAPTVTLLGSPANYGIFVRSGQCYSRRIWPRDVTPDLLDGQTMDPATTRLRVNPNEAIAYSFQSIRPVTSGELKKPALEFCEGGLVFVPESNHHYDIAFRGGDACDVKIADSTGAEPKDLRIFHSTSELFGGSGIRLCTE